MKKASRPHFMESLGYIKCYSSSSSRLLKALAILSDTTKPYWKSENWLHFFWWSTILLFISFSKTLLTTERRLTGRYVLAVDLSPTFLNAVTTNIFMPLSLYQYLYTIIQHLSGTYWTVQPVYIKVQVHSSLEPALEYNQYLMPLMSQG